jgi:hypothetical protein
MPSRSHAKHPEKEIGVRLLFGESLEGLDEIQPSQPKLFRAKRSIDFLNLAHEFDRIESSPYRLAGSAVFDVDGTVFGELNLLIVDADYGLRPSNRKCEVSSTSYQ